MISETSSSEGPNVENHSEFKILLQQPISTICCLGADEEKVSLCIVIAHMCPALKVFVVDTDTNKVTTWNTRQIPSCEPGLDEMLKKCLNKNIFFTVDTEGVIIASDLIFISAEIFPRNKGDEDGEAPYAADVETTARLIAEYADDNKIIVENCTGPVGIHNALAKILEANKKPYVDFQLLSNPKFFSAGTAIQNLLDPEYVLIGSDSTPEGLAAAESLADVYTKWVPREKIVTMGTWAAELTKLCSNAFLAQRLSSVSALSMVCEAMHVDLEEVIRLLGKSNAIGSSYLEPSLGFGGGNLKKDLKCLIHIFEKSHLQQLADYWKQVIEINELQTKKFVKKILDAFSNSLNHKKIAVWGFAFKKNVDQTANSPAINVCKHMLEEGAKLSIYDPVVEKRQIMEELQRATGRSDLEKCVAVCEDAYKAALKSHAVVLCTDWDEFKSLDFAAIYKEMMRPAYIFDGRNCLDHQELKYVGFELTAIGKESKKNWL